MAHINNMQLEVARQNTREIAYYEPALVSGAVTLL